MFWKKPTAKEWVALGVVVIVAGAVALLFRTNAAHLRDTLGPTRIAAVGDGGWWAISHHHLHRFDAAGRRIAKISLERFGIDNPVTGLAVLGDGRVLLAEPNSSSFSLCNSSATECSPLSLRRDGKSVKPVQVALLQGVDANRFVVSDRDGRRLLLVSDRGEILTERALSEAAADAYHVPYQPRMSFDGELLIPNRKDRKILRLNGATLEPVGDAFGVSGAKGARRGLPVDVARAADGRWWVLNVAPCICDGEIVEFDAQTHPVRRVALRGIHDPRSMALIGERLLIADQDGAELNSYDITTGTQLAIPDVAFRAELDGIRSLREQGDRSWPLLLGVIVGAPAIGVLMLWLLGERMPLRRQPMRPAADRAPLSEGITWIEATPEYAALLRQRDFAGWILAGVGVVAVGLIGNWLAVLPLLALMLGAFIYERRKGARRPPRIGTDGTLLYYESRRNSVTAPLSEVLTDGWQVVAGKHAVVLCDTRVDYFNRDAVASVILARLPREALVTQGKLLGAMMRRQPLRWVLVALMCALMLAMLFIKR